MRVGVGISCEKLSWQAGLQGATVAVNSSGQAKLAIVVVTSDYDCSAVRAGVRSALGTSKLAGPLGGQVPFLGGLASGEIVVYDDVPPFHNKSISLLMAGE